MGSAGRIPGGSRSVSLQAASSWAEVPVEGQHINSEYAYGRQHHIQISR